MKNRLPRWAQLGRSGWRFDGQRRPEFAKEPGPGQESVWDYPRPPCLAEDSRAVIVRAGGVTIAETRSAIRVLETASPPTFYLPPADIDMDRLQRAPGASRCEWKGTAHYWSVITPEHAISSCGWSYPEPFSEFAAIRDCLSFYPAQLECLVEGDRVLPQPGRFYGGWITPEVVGPFKGERGSEGW